MNGACSNQVCTDVGGNCSTAATCCTGVCTAGKCAANTAVGGSCKVLGQACSADGGSGECCSTLCKGGVCSKAYYCQANGDVCYANSECCGGVCSGSGGMAGRCQEITGSGGGGCIQQGNPCSGGSNCCSRVCFDPGSGATVCLPAGGCRLTGTSCTSDNACCGGGVNPNGSVTCAGQVSGVGRCDNGQACNPVGNICGAPVLADGGKINASQDCCDGKKAVCKPDLSGIPRCFGGGSGSCPTGYTGAPGCCIAEGDVCQFRDQCCSGLPCLPADGGLLRCTKPACNPLGGTCTTSANCCVGDCVNGVCRGLVEGGGPGGDGGFTVGDGGVLYGPDGGLVRGPDGGVIVVGDGGTLCVANNGSCSSSSQCCSMVCTGGACKAAAVCQPTGGTCSALADCCVGNTCAIPSGAANGTCQPSACPGIGQTCSQATPCCTGASCIDTATGASCGAMGSCVCQGSIG